jgi:hypothetical protein
MHEFLSAAHALATEVLKNSQKKKESQSKETANQAQVYISKVQN